MDLHELFAAVAQLMYAFGDSRTPHSDSIACVQAMTLDFIQQLVSHSLELVSLSACIWAVQSQWIRAQVLSAQRLARTTRSRAHAHGDFNTHNQGHPSGTIWLK